MWSSRMTKTSLEESSLTPTVFVTSRKVAVITYGVSENSPVSLTKKGSRVKVGSLPLPLSTGRTAMRVCLLSYTWTVAPIAAAPVSQRT